MSRTRQAMKLLAYLAVKNGEKDNVLRINRKDLELVDFDSGTLEVWEDKKSGDVLVQFVECYASKRKRLKAQRG